MRNASNSTVEGEWYMIPLRIVHALLVNELSADIPVDLNSLVEHSLSLDVLALVANRKQRSAIFPKCA